ncbi:hypothetical protein, partial [Staphylococcus aureus]|uniref:hypothetical protein n=1 Tax=Staphylococcus aureus TaxID=1280 RepID=UPI0032B600C9
TALIAHQQQERMPVPCGMLFMSAEVKPATFVNVEACHDPTVRRQCEPNVISFDQGAMSDVDEAMAENVLFQQQLAVASLEGP